MKVRPSDPAPFQSPSSTVRLNRSLGSVTLPAFPTTFLRDTCFVLEGAGHAPFWQKPTAYNILLRDSVD